MVDLYVVYIDDKPDKRIFPHQKMSIVPASSSFKKLLNVLFYKMLNEINF